MKRRFTGESYSCLQREAVKGEPRRMRDFNGSFRISHQGASWVVQAYKQGAVFSLPRSSNQYRLLHFQCLWSDIFHKFSFDNFILIVF